MTNGSSQGLFVIVAVVIFGIFVLISYMLFGDKMKTSLASIFDTGISQVDLDNNPEGIEETEESQFIFNKETGSVEGLKPAFEGTETQINIPEEIKGEPVTNIEDNAFKDEKFTTLVLPDSVESIGENAFYNSPIAKLSVKKNVVVGKDAFYTAERLTNTEISFSGYSNANVYDGNQTITINNQPIFNKNLLLNLNSDSNLRQGADEFLFNTYDYALDEYSNELIQNRPAKDFTYTFKYDKNLAYTSSPDKEDYNGFEISSDQFSQTDVSNLFSYIENNATLNPDMDVQVYVYGSNVIKSVKVNGKEFPVTEIKGNQKYIRFKLKDIPNTNFNVSKDLNMSQNNGYNLTSDSAFVANTKTKSVEKVELKDYLGNRYNSSHSSSARLDLTATFNIDVETSSGQVYSDTVTYEHSITSKYDFGVK